MSFLKKLFGLEKSVAPAEDAVGYVTTLHGNAELAVAESLLRDAEISYRLVDRNEDGLSRLVAGYTIYGTDVFVRPEDVETAKALLVFTDDGTSDACENEKGDEADV